MEEERSEAESLPEERNATAAEAAGVPEEQVDEGRKPPEDDLDSDPAYNPDDEAGDYKGG
jgi:hypothetical protein